MSVSEGEEAYACVEQMSLTGLTTGTYNICVMAHTAAGGAAGPWQMVAVGKNDAIWVDFLIHSCLYKHSFIFKPVCVCPNKGLRMYK